MNSKPKDIQAYLNTNIPDIEIPEISEIDIEEHFPKKPIKPIEKNRSLITKHLNVNSCSITCQQKQKPFCLNNINTNTFTKKCSRLYKNNKQN